MISKISIILPIYNSEKYLSETLESLINQTFADIEIICIDDCSTDKSLDILNSYADKDPRIHVLKNEVNKGPGATRNRALDIAQGDYILFLDSDDYLTQNACEVLYNQAVKNKNDMVLFNFCRITGNKTQISDRLSVFEPYIGKNIKLRNLGINFFISTYPWAQMYSKDFLGKNEIRFSNHKCCEDDIFVIKAFLNSESASICPQALYYYRIRKDSQMRKPELYMDVIKAKDLCFEYVKSNHPEVLNYFLDYYISGLVYYLKILKRKKHKLYKDYFETVRQRYKNISENYSADVLEKISDFVYLKKIINKSSLADFISVFSKDIFHKIHFIFSRK